MDALFEVHTLNTSGRSKAQAIATAFDDLLENLELWCNPNGREFSLVRTKLEEACFFAKKSMAMIEDNQEQQG